MMTELDPPPTEAKRPAKADYQAAVAAVAATLGDEGARVRDVVDLENPRTLVNVVRVLASELLAALGRGRQDPQEFVRSWGLRVAGLADDAPEETATPVQVQPVSGDDFPTDPQSLGRTMQAVLAATTAAQGDRADECWAILRDTNLALSSQISVSLLATVLGSLEPGDAAQRMLGWFEAARELRDRT